VYDTARANGLGDERLAHIAKAVVAGRVATLLIAADREVPGRLEAATGGIKLANPANPEVDDVLDDLGALALKMGGKVVILPTERMPTATGVAAIYRY
jgi:stalled ribosome rescue protein Dom34